jgi:glycosyltransferase involved in cell wall biosynthesis
MTGYGTHMLTEPAAREAEVKALSRVTASPNAAAVGGSLMFGVTVVVPSFSGVNRIGRCLRSLVEQDLAPAHFEVVVVVNGEDDGTVDFIRTFRSEYPEHSIRICFLAVPSAGAARNVGIRSARFSYLTFVDDDDEVGPEFLKSLLAVASPSCVGVAPIIDVTPDGTETVVNRINAQITSRSTAPFALSSVPVLAGFNACKLFPTAALHGIRYPEDLASGEDICFMAAVTVANSFEARVASTGREAAYFRHLRPQSMSRQKADFAFSVTQRLEVMRRLERNRSWDGSHNDNLLRSLVRAQANFLRAFLQAEPDARAEVEAAVEASGVREFPWPILNDGLARDLVVSYCFAPYADTSAVVAAKAIRERGRVVDVISNRMNQVRTRDESLNLVAGRFIDKAVEIDTPPSFAGWKPMAEFVRKGLAVADRQHAAIGGYRTVYSRVLWPASHFLAAVFKLRHPEVRWTAEFSDPLTHDALGRPRPGSIEHDELYNALRRGLSSRGFAPPKSESLFSWCEYVTYVLADELIFTNENQLEVMLLNVKNRKLRGNIRDKATIRRHPTLPPSSYDLVPSSYGLDDGVINIGYFGAFYENRGMSDLLTALAGVPVPTREKIRLHIFTSKSEELRSAVAARGLEETVHINPYRPFLEFLNLTSRFDVLLVNDVLRGADLPLNPFLPSKYSDYAGSGVPVWAMVEEGSPLSRLPARYRTPVGDVARAQELLEQLVLDRAPQQSPRNSLDVVLP